MSWAWSAKVNSGCGGFLLLHGLRIDAAEGHAEELQELATFLVGRGGGDDGDFGLFPTLETCLEKLDSRDCRVWLGYFRIWLIDELLALCGSSFLYGSF